MMYVICLQAHRDLNNWVKSNLVHWAKKKTTHESDIYKFLCAVEKYRPYVSEHGIVPHSEKAQRFLFSLKFKRDLGPESLTC